MPMSSATVSHMDGELSCSLEPGQEQEKQKTEQAQKDMMRRRSAGRNGNNGAFIWGMGGCQTPNSCSILPKP